MDRLLYFQQFHSISQQEYDLLASALKEKSFKKGTALVVPGQIQKELYLIKSGVQMSYVESRDSTQVIAFTYSPNLCAIPESFSLQQASRYFLSCLSDSEMDCITFDDLQKLFDQSQGIERLFRKMTEVMLAGMINRHIELHALSIEERYLAFCNRSPHLLQLVPHKYIASYLGINASNFSKLYNKVKI